MATWDESGIRPDFRDESPGYDPPTPADEGFEYELEAHLQRVARERQRKALNELMDLTHELGLYPDD
jgi:hypothetical protein